jgi:LPXTG-site transpeptidase (sortase) family protein
MIPFQEAAMNRIVNRPTIQFLQCILILMLFLSAAVPGSTLARGAAGTPAKAPAQPAAAGPTTGLGAIQTYNFWASNPNVLGEFGWAVDVSINNMVVGARNEDGLNENEPVINSGAAYVYQRSGNSWMEQARLLPKGLEQGDTFGASVTVDGSTAVIGATGVDVETAEDAGAAYVFQQKDDGWKQMKKLTLSDPVEGDSFGTSVALYQNTLVVGADSRDLGPLIDAGAAYVYINSGGEWALQATLLPIDSEPAMYFGNSVAISGNVIVVGATEAGYQGIHGPGAAYVFRKVGKNWVQEAKLQTEKGRQGDFFGASVSVESSTVVVGAPFFDVETDNGRLASAGSAFVFDYSGSSWTESAQLSADDPQVFDQFGSSVSISAGRVVVGAPRKAAWGLTDAGTSYLFTQKGKDWNQQFKILPQQPMESARFGNSIAIDGGTIAVGARGSSPLAILGAGETYLYKLGTVQLPETGYTRSMQAALSTQLFSRVEQASSGVELDIPKLGVRVEVVGASKGGSGWLTSELWDQVGYLEGTAFPTWPGNTALAGHTNLPNGLQGPFAHLGDLRWGDQVLLHAWGQTYVYEVRENLVVRPEDTRVLRHETYDWLTMITCADYDVEGDQFLNRQVVRAVLVEVRDR